MQPKILMKRVFKISILILILIVLYGVYNDFYKLNVEDTGPNPMLVMNQIRNAIKNYCIDTKGQYPTNIDVLVGKYLTKKPLAPSGLAYILDTKEHEIYYLDYKNRKTSIKYEFNK